MPRFVLLLFVLVSISSPTLLAQGKLGPVATSGFRPMLWIASLRGLWPRTSVCRIRTARSTNSLSTETRM